MSISIAREASLIQEELVRQIREADRWSAVVEAWQALLKVRRMAESLEAEPDEKPDEKPDRFEFVDTEFASYLAKRKEHDFDSDLEILIPWLKSHEDDIAHDINDFGELAPVFESVFMKKPKPGGEKY